MKLFGKNLLIGAFLLSASVATAQSGANDPVLMTIDGKPVTKSEFEAVFFKNNPTRNISSPTAVEEYLDLFINFKLKVKEAEEMGLDTLKTFQGELNGYKKQLSGPYLTDKGTTEALVNEAYERMKTEVHASHILIRCPEDALPKDTLDAWNLINNYRNRALKGEDFGRLAKESADKGDASAKENFGDLGFFSAFSMVYTFESTAFNTKPGEISMPVRSRFGYHIVKVWERRPSMGEVLVSHIMLRIKKGATKEDSANVKKKIFEIHEKLKGGSSFEDMASQFSDDKNTASKGGELPWFSSGKMPSVEFEKNAFALKNNGDISEPFTTSFGWHIIKRKDHKGLASLESMKGELKQKVAKDQRSQVGRSNLIARIKKENNFSENTVTVKKKKVVTTTFPALDELVAKMDTTYWDGKWTADKAKGLNSNLFSLAGKNYTQQDFAKYLETRQTRRAKNDFRSVAMQQYNVWVNESCISLEENSLDKKYPEFKALMQEYRDGILLFDLTDKKVWTKAMKDTTGLKAFYEENKNNYLWDERADVTLYKCADEKTATAVAGLIKKKKSDKDITDAMNKTSQLNLSIENIMYLKGERKIVDANWKEGVSAPVKDETDGKTYLVRVNKILPKSPKALNEAKGMITADYQNYLEKKWLESLRQKHKVEVNREVLKQVK